MKQYLECGKVVSTHGVHGEVRVQHWCDDAEYLLAFPTLHLSADGSLPRTVERARVHKGMVILKLQGIDTMDDAGTLRGQILYINRGDAPQEADGVFFVQDLLGISVIDADTGYHWGTLSDVFSTGVHDVYEITGADGKKRLAPAIPDVITETNLEQRSISIRPLKGLFDDED